MKFVYVAAALLVIANFAFAQQYLGKGYFLYDNVTVGNVGEIVVAANTTMPVDLIVIPSSNYGSFINGGGFTTIYNKTVGTGIEEIQLPAGKYTIVAQAMTPTKLTFGVVSVPDGAGSIFDLNGEYKYYFNLTNYSKVYVTLLAAGEYSNNPLYVNISGTGAAVNPTANLDTLNISQNRGEGNVTVTAPGKMEMFIYVNYTPELVAPLDQIVPGANYSVGVASYGLYNISGKTYPYQVKTDEVVGVANITALSAYNPNPPQNSSASGASLQLNVGLNTYVDNKLKVFWLQDVADFNTSSNQYYFVDNIWNNTGSDGDLSNSSLIGRGNLSVCSSCNQNFYVDSYPVYFLNYSLPLRLQLVILENQTQAGSTLYFGYQILRNGTQGLQPLVFFDRVLMPGSTNTTLLTTPYYQTPGVGGVGSFYDSELVFGGEASGENTQFNDINSTLWIYYKNSSGVLVPFPSVYTFGLSTAESASNAGVVAGPEGSQVVVGNPNFATDIFTQNALDSVATYISNTSSYTTATTTVQPVPVNPFQGSAIPQAEIDTFVVVAGISIVFIVVVGFFLLRRRQQIT